MHPYRMQTLIKERGKDQVANAAQRNSVYQTIEALLRAGLIEVKGTSREENRPERTVYQATEQGRWTFLEWMRTALSTPAREFPEFPAALSHLAVLEPKDAREQLEKRIRALEERLAEHDTPFPGLPPVLLLESEYMAAVLRAELEWLRGICAELKSGRLRWSERGLRAAAAQFQSPPEEEPGSESKASGSSTSSRSRRAAKARRS